MQRSVMDLHTGAERRRRIFAGCGKNKAERGTTECRPPRYTAKELEIQRDAREPHALANHAWLAAKRGWRQ